MAFARLLRNLVRDPADRAAGGPDRPRRGPDLRPRAAHRRGQDLRPRGPALHPGRRRPPPALRREHLGPGPPGGDHRGRRPGLVHRPGHRLRHLGPAHAAGLPLLLHVRVPAGRRPRLGSGRHPGPGHPGRLHGRAHHAAGRGPPARRRPLAPAGLGQPRRPGLRPCLRLRGGGHHGGRRSPRMLGPEPEDRFWYLTLYNENYPMPALPEGEEGEAVRRGIVARHLPLRRPHPRRSGRACGRRCASRARCGSRPWRPAHPGRALGRRRPTPGR